MKTSGGGISLADGFFDGVHLGHRAILAGADAVFTFDDHPMKVLAPARSPQLIMAPQERLDYLKTIVSDVFAYSFTPQFAQLSPRAFAETVLKPLNVREVRCGANWRFGHGGVGTPALLREFGYTVTVVPFVEAGGEIVSSTRIRAAIQAGDLRLAATLLGRNWTLSGTLKSGKGLGHQEGVATLNLHPEKGRVTPPLGVYAVRYARCPAIANWGVSPTCGSDAWKEPVLEVHLIGDEEANSAALARDAREVEFVSFLREERRFETMEALYQQIREDIVRCRTFLAQVSIAPKTARSQAED